MSYKKNLYMKVKDEYLVMLYCSRVATGFTTLHSYLFPSSVTKRPKRQICVVTLVRVIPMQKDMENMIQCHI